MINYTSAKLPVSRSNFLVRTSLIMEVTSSETGGYEFANSRVEQSAQNFLELVSNTSQAAVVAWLTRVDAFIRGG